MRLEYSDITKSLHDVAIKKVSADLRKKGYKVCVEYPIDKYRVDLFAEKDNEKELYEFKVGNNPIGIEYYTCLQTFAKKNSAKLKIVYVSPPQISTKIKFDKLSDILLDYIQSDIPDDLDSLATHVFPEGIENLVISDLEIGNQCIVVSGNAELDAKMQFGSDRDVARNDGDLVDETYGFDYQLTLSFNFEIKKADLKFK